ncbi:MAG TPA: rRNA maturation RNase YbeY [Candidatus Hydrogenedentes bacterium]|nr:rRNA maturation RNase YbeY [Candidatus Hydrogenedentota bacterium]
MGVELRIRNESSRKRLYRRDVLTRLLERILAGESITEESELSVLFCDDEFIQELNRQYCNKNRPTDVLSFEQDGLHGQTRRVLGDIVISLETVESNCESDADAMRDEVRLLVCHGALHLLGYDHGSAEEKAVMVEKQAEYLGVSAIAAWDFASNSKLAGVAGSRRNGEAFSGGR